MSKAPSAIKLYKGLSLYRVERSTKWYVRVWDKKTKSIWSSQPVRDVRQIRTHTFQEYIADLTKRRPSLAASTKNTLMAAFRNVMKIARDEGVVEVVPQTPRVKSKDNPRPFFRFHPLVAKEDDNYQKLLATVIKSSRGGG